MQTIYLKEMNDFKKNPSSEVSQDQYYNKMKSLSFSNYDSMNPNLNYIK